MWPPSSDDSLLAWSTRAAAFQRIAERSRRSTSGSPGIGSSSSGWIVLTYGVLSLTGTGAPARRASVITLPEQLRGRSGPARRSTSSSASSHSSVSRGSRSRSGSSGGTGGRVSAAVATSPS